MGPQMEALLINRNLRQILAALAAERRHALWEAR
jgi:hypothetical protein